MYRVQDAFSKFFKNLPLFPYIDMPTAAAAQESSAQAEQRVLPVPGCYLCSVS
jgi:hypothetical protein